MAENPSNDIGSFAPGQSFDQILGQAFAEVSGANPPEKQPEPQQHELQPDQVEKPSPSATPSAEEVVEFEGKQYKIEKSAKDYFVEAQNAKKGMRKFQAERDKEIKKFKEREQDLVRYEQITSTFKNKGIEGMYDALAGKDGAYQEMLKKRDEITLRKYNATEDELRVIHQEEMIERERHLREVAEKTMAETLERTQKQEMEAQKNVLSARVNEAFEAVSFEGKLGDAKREEKFNKYIWEQARMQLKEYADGKGIGHHEIPSKIVKSVFAEVAADFGDVIKKQAASEIVKQTQTSSDAATLAAQAKSTSSPVKEDNTLKGLADKHKNPHDFINALFNRG